MSKKKKIEIHQDEELAQIDEELESALGMLESANLAVGGVLEEIEVSNKQEPDEEATPHPELSVDNGVKNMDSPSSKPS